jgi:hypothetical protein
LSTEQPPNDGGIKYTGVQLFPPDMKDSERMECLRELGRQHDAQFTDSFGELRRRMMLGSCSTTSSSCKDCSYDITSESSSQAMCCLRTSS